MASHEGRWYSDGGYIFPHPDDCLDCDHYEVTDGSGRVLNRYRDPLKNADRRAIEMADTMWDSIRKSQQEAWDMGRKEAEHQLLCDQQREYEELAVRRHVEHGLALMQHLDAMDQKAREKEKREAQVSAGRQLLEWMAYEGEKPLSEQEKVEGRAHITGTKLVKADWKTADKLGVEATMTSKGYVLQTKDGKPVTWTKPTDPQALAQWLQPADLAYFRDHHYTGTLAGLAGVTPPRPPLVYGDSRNIYIRKPKKRKWGKPVNPTVMAVVFTALVAVWVVFVILSFTVGKPQTHHKAPSTTQQHQQGPQGAPGPAGQGRQLKSTKVVQGHVIITYTDGTTSDAGLVKGH